MCSHHKLVERAKIMQFPDTLIAELSGKTETEIANLTRKHHIQPIHAVNMMPVGTHGELPYYYSSTKGAGKLHNHGKSPVIILGSGPILHRPGH